MQTKKFNKPFSIPSTEDVLLLLQKICEEIQEILEMDSLNEDMYVFGSSCTFDDFETKGFGPSKKEAKRNAAKEMWMKLNGKETELQDSGASQSTNFLKSSVSSQSRNCQPILEEVIEAQNQTLNFETCNGVVAVIDSLASVISTEIWYGIDEICRNSQVLFVLMNVSFQGRLSIKSSSKTIYSYCQP